MFFDIAIESHFSSGFDQMQKNVPYFFKTGIDLPILFIKLVLNYLKIFQSSGILIREKSTGKKDKQTENFHDMSL